MIEPIAWGDYWTILLQFIIFAFAVGVLWAAFREGKK